MTKRAPEAGALEFCPILLPFALCGLDLMALVRFTRKQLAAMQAQSKVQNKKFESELAMRLSNAIRGGGAPARLHAPSSTYDCSCLLSARSNPPFLAHAALSRKRRVKSLCARCVCVHARWCAPAIRGVPPSGHHWFNLLYNHLTSSPSFYRHHPFAKSLGRHRDTAKDA